MSDILDALNKHTTKDSVTDCWLFTGSLTNGYGKITLNGQSQWIHRLSAHLYLEYDLTDKVFQVNHRCKNRNCWNPAHLYVGTQQQNVQETTTGRHAPKTHCIRGHEYTPKNTIITKKGKICKECKRNRERLRYHGIRY